MLDSLITRLGAAAESDIFAGGLALGTFGLAVGLLGAVARALVRLVLRRFVVSIEVDNRTAAFGALNHWLDETGVLAHVRHVRAGGLRRSGACETLAPAPGSHWFCHQGRFVRYDRHISEKNKAGPAYEPRPLETISLTMPFGRLSTLKGWVEDGQAMARQAERIGPGIHMLSQDHWEWLGEVPERELASVLADDDRIERLVADVARFLDAAEWYATRGVPWRRGYLLYGPPGTGKSSAIRAVASVTQRDIASLDIARAGLSDDALREAMATAPKNAILAIEDVDAVFSARDPGEKRVGVSFSGLLNAIDGIAAQEGRPLFLTTNHRDRLDPALIRPGRTDVHVELGPVGSAAAARLFLRFFPGEAALAARFEARLGSARFVPAALQGWLLSAGEDAERAATAEGLLEAGCRDAA